ncbi:hypothetical protein [Natronorubrum sp. DTA7]|uniref:hypothetical protein n=1 Tax=Natronorubrum sp. DTA7 TaxID=3447016 RepID=UPI003F86E1DC
MSTRERFWDIVCDFRAQFRLLLFFLTTLLVLTVVTMLLGEQRTDAYVISLVTIALLLATIVPVSYCVWRCGTSENEFETDRE